jgi:Common central domain of tyrosinase/von Willebrand factor type A domain
VHCRIDFMNMAQDSAAVDRLADGLNDLWDRGIINARANEHDASFNSGIHWAPQFLCWHRHFLLRLEHDLQDFDDRIVLPYWDWTRADSGDLDAEPWKSFFGGRNNAGGRFDHWTYTRRSNDGGYFLPSVADIVAELRNKANFTAYRAVECGSHFPGHNWTGGTMASGSSPFDPLFYLHHGNIDRLWAVWQRNNPGAVQYDTDSIGCDHADVPAVSLNNPMIGGATPASMLVHTALDYHYPRDIPLELAVAGDPDFPNFQSGDSISATLMTTQVMFNDVPADETVMRAALFEVETCAPLTFEVESGPTGNFSLFQPGPYTFPTSDFPTTEFRIWAMFTGAPSAAIPPGGTVNDPGGTMTIVARDPDGDEVLREDIPILANTVARPTSAVALLLDESGSMLSDAGNNRIRLNVLKDAAKSLVDLLYDDNGLTLISFADAAEKLTDLKAAGPLASAARTDAHNEIDAHGPPNAMPLTSIGAGLQAAANEYATSSNAGDYAVQATVVFTDGYETTAPYINQVAQFVTDRVYAVGIADADNVANDTLEALASGSNGFMLVTGALQQDDDFLLEKFFIQVLVGVTNQDIVRDPSGWLRPGAVARIPFDIADSDYAFDTVVLNRAPRYVLTALQAPDGTIIAPQDLAGGATRIGHNLNGFRVNQPVVKNNVGHWAGRWRLLLALGLKSPNTAAVARMHDDVGLTGQTLLKYEAIIHARSNLHLRVRSEQENTLPGTPILLLARLTEYGQPFRGTAKLRVILTEPDGSVIRLAMSGQGEGRYGVNHVPQQRGAHRFRVIAEGLSVRGRPFTREHLLSALVGRAGTGPSGGAPGSAGDGQGGAGGVMRCICDLIECFGDNGIFDENFCKRIDSLGIDRNALLKCIQKRCIRDRTR